MKPATRPGLPFKTLPNEKLNSWPFWAFVAGPLAFMLLFAAGMFTPIFMGLGFIFALFSTGKYRARIHPLALTIGVPLAVAAFAAPTRAFFMTLASLDGGVGWPNDIARNLSLPGAWLEYTVGAAGTWFGINVFLSDGFWRLRQARQIDALPTSTIRSAAQGLVELKGKAARPALWLAYFPSLFRFTYDRDPFVIRDETGWAVVDPRHAEMRRTFTFPFVFGRRVSEIVLTKHEGMVFDWQKQPCGNARWLEDGDEVYVIGHLRTVRARKLVHVPGIPDGISPDAEISVIGPSPEHGKGDNLLRIFFGKLFKARGHDSQDVFFLSDTGEASAKKHVRKGIGFTVFWSLLWIACSLALALYLRPHPKVFSSAEGDPYNPSYTTLRANLLESKSAALRLQAADLLGQYYSRDLHRIRLFHDALKKEQVPEIRRELAWGLSRIAELNYHRRQPLEDAWSWEIVTALQTASQDEPSLHLILAYTLGYLPAVQAHTVPLLEAYLQAADEETREHAARSLEWLLKESEGAKRVLFAHATDPASTVQLIALNVLAENLSPVELGANLPFVQLALRSEDWRMRSGGLEMISRMGERARPIVGELLPLLGDDEKRVRDSAVRALHGVGGGYAEALPALVEIVESERGDVLSNAIRALGALGAEAADALPVLERVAADSRSKYQADLARRAIRQIEAALPR